MEVDISSVRYILGSAREWPGSGNNGGSGGGGGGSSVLYIVCCTWQRHQMETFSALLAICAGSSSVTGEFTTRRPVTRNFYVSFDLRPNKRLSKQS